MQRRRCPIFEKETKATSSSIASEFESLTLLRQEQMANDALLWQEQMADEKQYKVMQLDIEEHKFKVDGQKMDMHKQELPRKIEKLKAEA